MSDKDPSNEKTNDDSKEKEKDNNGTNSDENESLSPLSESPILATRYAHRMQD